MVPHVVKWTDGEPAEVIPGLCVQYESGLVELVGSQRHILTGPVRRHTHLIELHELDWIESMASRRGL